MDIPEHLSQSDAGLTRAETARVLVRSVSGIFRMLVLLQDRGYIVFDPGSDRYVLTTLMVEIAHRTPLIRSHSHEIVDSFVVKGVVNISTQISGHLREDTGLMTLTDPRLMLLFPGDTVFVLRDQIEAGEAVFVEGLAVSFAHPLGLGHKIARLPVKIGQQVIKYGAAIGRASRPIAPGDLVHLHNLVSDYTPTYALNRGE